MIFANTGNHSPKTTKSHPRKLTLLVLYAAESRDKVEVHSLFMQIVVQLISGGLRIKIFCHVQIFICKLTLLVLALHTVRMREVRA